MKRSIRTAAVCAVAALALSACSSATSSEDSADKGTLGPEAQQASDIVARASGAKDEFKAPGPAIPGVKAMSGKVVYYVAASIKVPLFKALSDEVTEAFKTVGVTVRVCDAQGNPGGAATCLGQAVDAKAAAVVVGGFPEAFAPTAFTAVRDAGIPVLFTLSTPRTSQVPRGTGYIASDYFALEALNANWVIADSNAKAHVLVVEATDNADLVAWVEKGALATYDKGCPACKVKVVTTTAAQLDKLPSLVTSALVADPSIDYVQVAFDDRLQAVMQGIQASSNRDVKVVSLDGTLPAMQNLAKGNMVASEVGFDQHQFSWFTADRALRLMAGQDAGVYTFPTTRLFTKQTAEKLTLTPAASVSGEWYGNADYRSGLKKLWGVD